MTPNPAPKIPKTESELLRHKAETAKQALINTLGSMKKSVSPSQQLSNWAQEHPLPSTGVALLAGFAIATPLSKSETSSPIPKADMGMEAWAVMLNTGADIVKAVLTPWLQEKIKSSGSKGL